MSKARLIWRIVRFPIRVALLLWIALTVAAAWLAPLLMFHPPRGDQPVPAGMRELRTKEGEAIAVLHLPNPQARFTLWYFHGNAESIATSEPWLRELNRAGFAVFAVDYPGYGRSTGRPSEQAIYAAIRVARDHLRRDLGVSASQTILYGNSLGGGPAVQAAIEERVAGLVLQLDAFTKAENDKPTLTVST